MPFFLRNFLSKTIVSISTKIHILVEWTNLHVLIGCFFYECEVQILIIFSLTGIIATNL